MDSPPLALVRVAALVPVVAFLRRTGAAVDRLLGRLDLPPFVFHSPESLIPLRQAVRFMEWAARDLDIRSLGALAARDTSIAALGVFGQLVRREPTLARAIETAVRAMSAFCSGVRSRLTICGARAELHHEFVDEYVGESRQALEYWATITCDLVGLAQGADGDRAHVVTPNGVTIAFPRPLLGRPLARPLVARSLNERDVEAWQASAPAGDFPGAVQQVIRALSSPTSPRIGLTAGAIGISVRGLQRRLAEAGVSYERLVFQSRFRTALRLLENPDVTVLDVALDAGYSDHAHFTRAFRRWTGMSPREFRRTRRSAAITAV